MTERFKQLYQLEDNLYTDAAPVIIEKGSLLLDKQTNTLLIQMKFHSLSVKKIKALTIRISTYYASGEKHPETVEYQYLDLLVEYGTRFGEKKAILLKEAVIRSFSIDSYSVVYEDKTVEEVKGVFKPLPVSKELQEEWINLELQKQYRMETTEEAKYIPIRYQNLWRCTCGEWNLRDTCSVCQSEKEKIFGKLNVQNLTAAMEDRLKKEAEEREEERKREEEEAQRQEALRQEEELKRANKRKKRKRVIKITAVIVLLIFLGGIYKYGIYPVIIKPNKTYKYAKELLSEKKYDDAISVFESLGIYRDAVDMIAEAKNQKATSLLEQKDYDAARKIFDELGKYESVKETTRQEAENLIDCGKYTEAIGLLKDYGDEKSKELIQEAKYECGLQSLKAKNYREAMAYFEQVKDYKDASTKIEECQQNLDTEGYIEGVEYDELMNNTDDYKQQKMKFSGTILNEGNTTDDTINYAIINVGANIFVTYYKEFLTEELSDYEDITVYGTFMGTYSYESVNNGIITLPWIHADIIEKQ